MARERDRKPIELEPGLAQRALGGDRAAFDAIIERLWGPVYVFIEQRVSDREGARDMTQDTFLQAFAKRAELRQERSFVAWIFAIASRKVIDRYRRAHLDPGPVEAGSQPERRDAHAGPAEFLEEQEECARVAAAVRKLDDLYRTVLILRYWSGLSPAQIARTLGEPEGTIRNRLFRAHRRLREAMESGTGKAGSGAPDPRRRQAPNLDAAEGSEPLVGSRPHEETST